jgi:hypothetical protein
MSAMSAMSDMTPADMAEASQGDLGAVDATPFLQPVVRLSYTPTPSQIHLNNGKAIAVDDAGVVHTVWQEVLQPGPSEGYAKQGQVYYSRSTDGGRTFSSPAALLAPNAIPNQGAPRLAVAGNSVFVTWFENDGTYYRVYLIASSDGGQTWGSRLMLGNGSFPSIAAWSDGSSAPSVYVAWNDPQVAPVPPAAVGVSEIFMVASSDGGKTFSAPVQVSSMDGHSSWTAAVAGWGQSVHVVWTDERNDTVNGVTSDCGLMPGPCNEEEYYRRSLDGGKTWGPEVRLTTDPLNMPKPSWCPSIAADHDAVHIVYFDMRTGNWLIYYRRSLDGGSTFENEVSLTDRLGGQPAGNWLRPSLAAHGSRLEVAFWQDEQAYAGIQAGTVTTVYSFGSKDNGVNWSAATKISAGSHAYYPAVALGPDNSAHWLWFDNPDGNDEIYSRRFGP